ncbi:MAG: hypothetical protein ACJ79K_03450 [Gemmatimonadaceae bacterium]
MLARSRSMRAAGYFTVSIAALTAIACTRVRPTGEATAREQTIAFLNGRWLAGGRFVAEPRYVVGAALRDRIRGRADSTVDLRGGFVVPPFGEAHNHNVEASSRVDALITRYLRDGVFYVENPNILPRSRAALAGKVDTPLSVDVAFANGGLTGSGGHPIELVHRNIGRGIWTEADGEGAFYWTVSDSAELEAKWPAIVAQKPDFIKVYLLYSEEYAEHARDTTTFGWRGLDPALLPDVVRRAHAASLRVAATNRSGCLTRCGSPSPTTTHARQRVAAWSS